MFRLDLNQEKRAMIRGSVIVGLSGLKRVEYWVRPITGKPTELSDDDPVWKTAAWRKCNLDAEPRHWQSVLPNGIAATEIWGFDPTTGKPREWPLKYSLLGWSASIEGLTPGKYEVRARAVDLNGFAQPEPRPYQKSGKNPVQVDRFEVAK